MKPVSIRRFQTHLPPFSGISPVHPTVKPFDLRALCPDSERSVGFIDLDWGSMADFAT